MEYLIGRIGDRTFCGVNLESLGIITPPKEKVSRCREKCHSDNTMRPSDHTTKLPKSLQDELDSREDYGTPRKSSGGPGGRNGSITRKERRKADRDMKTARQRRGQTAKEVMKERRVRQAQSVRIDRESPKTPVMSSEMPTKTLSTPTSNTPLKSILKRPETFESNIALQDSATDVKMALPTAMSIGVRDKLDDDDAQIAALEKRLGMKGRKKKSKAFADDGLDFLIDDGSESDDELGERHKRKLESEDWLVRKRMKAGGEESPERVKERLGFREVGQAYSEQGGLDGVSQEGDEESEKDSEVVELIGKRTGSSNFSVDEGLNHSAPNTTRENPYVAPAALTLGAAPAKYIPPSLRATAGSDAEALTRLKRQAQGLLNKLSDANLVSILEDVEKLYRDNPRQSVTSTLTELLLGLVCDRSSLQETFIILHAGFISAVYKIIGPDFGAEVVSKIVETFDHRYSSLNTANGGKEAINLIALVSELYNFHVVGGLLIFDYVRTFLMEMTETNTELLLKIIRNSGPQLRQDDPSALKDLVLMIQPSVAKVGERNLSVRTRFMIETITNLKNNRMKTDAATSAINSEHATRMKKALGSLNKRTIRATEPLRIGLQDIRMSDKRGKWWLVGASWNDPYKHGIDVATSKAVPDEQEMTEKELESLAGDSTDLVQLANHQRMNTEVRRSVFISIMSSPDYHEAHRRLLKLHLKRNQEQEIPRVLMHCAGAEEAYNPYYTLIARRLCREKKFKMAFQFALWDIFQRTGEVGHNKDAVEADDEENTGDFSLRSVVNLAKMFGNLVADGGLSITILKTLTLHYLQPKTQTFVELLLVTVILQSQRLSKDSRDESRLLDIFIKVKETPQMLNNLQWFLKKVVSKTSVIESESERRLIQWACTTLKVKLIL